LCLDCQELIQPVKQPLCNICGAPTSLTSLCFLCKKNRPPFSSLRSWAVFDGPVQKAVHRIKYKRDISLGFVLANLMTNFVENLRWPIDIVVPVPLGKKRKTERGYNQVSLIAYPLALSFGWKYMPGGLIRIRETESQVGLNVKDRHENVKGAFSVNSKKIVGKNILLIDDVATTGATLSSCSEALITGGALNVYAVTLARAKAKKGLSAI